MSIIINHAFIITFFFFAENFRNFQYNPFTEKWFTVYYRVIHYLKTCKEGIMEKYRIIYDFDSQEFLGIPISSSRILKISMYQEFANPSTVPGTE